MSIMNKVELDFTEEQVERLKKNYERDVEVACNGISCLECPLQSMSCCSDVLDEWITRNIVNEKQQTVYLAGDLCKKGNVLLREKEAEYIRKHPQLKVYSPIEDKEINDKTNQTEEGNKYLCDKIYNKDMSAIRESKYIIMDVDNDSVGTMTELGAIAEFNWYYDRLQELIEESPESDLKSNLKAFMDKFPKKKVYFHNSDIRNTELAEQGMFRSYSFNQFSHGAVRVLNEKGVSESFEACVDEILNDIQPKQRKQDKWVDWGFGLYQCPWDKTCFSTSEDGCQPFHISELEE